jgi:hypothetical protein
MQNHQGIPERMLWCGVHSTDGLIECMLCQMTRTVGTPTDVMEVDGEIECHAKARWVPRW